MDKDTFLSIERLYHFTNRCSALKILSSGKLKFSELKRMNDINESYRQIFTKNGIKSTDVEKELAKYKQISLTHDGQLMGFAIPSMWGHYAEKGYGVCLVFDKEKLLKTIPADCCSSGDIRYSADYGNAIVAQDDVESYFNLYKDDLFFTKTIDWEYEQEFRIITKSDYAIEYKDSLIAVIMYFAEDVPNSDSISNCEMVRSIKKIVPTLTVLEFSYFLNESQLQEGDSQWYPPKDYTIDA